MFDPKTFSSDVIECAVPMDGEGETHCPGQVSGTKAKGPTLDRIAVIKNKVVHEVTVEDVRSLQICTNHQRYAEGENVPTEYYLQALAQLSDILIASAERCRRERADEAVKRFFASFRPASPVRARIERAA